MKQIYNLLETIKDDKQRVVACEKHLRYLKGQLSVHEEALKRITSVPEGAFSKDNPSENGSSDNSRVRITQDNWKSLGIEVGDTVEIVVSGDHEFMSGTKGVVHDLEDDSYDGCMFLNITTENVEETWYGFSPYEDEDELYLIKQIA